METQFITLQVSAPIYWGFQYKVPLVYAISVSMETLIKELQAHMKHFFSTHNLLELRDGVDKLHLHTHQTIISHTDNVIYLCNHEENEN